MARVGLSDIRKRFGSVEVINGVSFEIADGEFVALVGPSGCGKTTLLRTIAGLEAVSGGEIRIGDRVVNTLAPKDRDVAMVFQNYALYPHMRIDENIGFSLEMRKVAQNVISDSVRTVAATLGLADYLARFPRQLSGGQRQRVAMGRAIVRNPEVFLFDEPLSNLDAKLRVQMRVELKALRQRLGTTSVYVTHDQVEAMTLADRVVVLDAGRVAQVGTPLELYDCPANVFVATFIGSPAMNIVDATIEGGAGGPVARLGADGAIPVDRDPSRLRNGMAVRIGVRPEHMAIVGAEEPGIPLVVDVVEPTGFLTIVYAMLGEAQLCLLFPERLALAPGDAIRVQPRPGTMHVFDAGTGERLA